MSWTEQHTEKVIDLKESHTWQEVAEIMSGELGKKVGIERCRHYYRKYREDYQGGIISDQYKPKSERVDNRKQRVTIEQKENGQQVSERTIEATEEQLKDVEFVLKSHNYDPTHWKVVKHRSSLWEQFSNKNGLRTLYASRLEVEPIGDSISFDEMVDVIVNSVEPVKISTPKYKVKDKRALNIFLSDLHFGINDIDYYNETLDRVTTLIKSNVWEEVIIPFGSDLLHVDNLNHTTTNQTRMDNVDIPKMIEDAKQFYVTIIDTAIKQSNKVNVLYISGNHDLSTSYLLSHWLGGYYKEVDKVTVCKQIEEIKIHMFGSVFMAFTHGDKGGKRRIETLPSQYPKEWAFATTREAYAGHLHYEQTVDKNGVTSRILPTKAQTDKWHKDNSFVGAHKRFQVFEYTSNELDKIHYV